VLEKVKKEIMQKYPNVDVKYIVQDVVNDPTWSEVEQQLQGINVSVLVNNVGGGTVGAGGSSAFHLKNMDDHRRVFDFNFVSALGYTSLLLPAMVERGKGR
jgi:short-subunit dehydrogenase